MAKLLLDSGKKQEGISELNLLLQQNPDHIQALQLKKKFELKQP